MAIKWKGWTSRLPVKICCVILMPVAAFIFLCGGIGLGRMNMSYGEWNVLFTSLGNNDYFFDSHVTGALYNAQTVLSFRNEESIRNMEYLEWRSADDYYSEYYGYSVAVSDVPEPEITISLPFDAAESPPSEEFAYPPEVSEDGWFELVSTNFRDESEIWGTVRASDFSSPQARRMIKGAVNNQINQYQSAKTHLETTNGLYYYLSNGTDIITNIPDRNGPVLPFFQEQPVYLIAENGRITDRSEHQGNGWKYYDIREPASENESVYIAFSKEAVAAQNAAWKSEQRQFIMNIALIIGSALAALVLLVVLMAGAGRRYGDDSGAVRFTALDKPWLDLGLAALIIYEMLFVYSTNAPIMAAWRYDNFRWLLLICALMAVGMTLPLLGWVLSFTKYCKAGKWRRHTLLYCLYDKFRSFVRSLWAGFPLTVKAALIGIVLLMAMGLCVFLEPTEFALFLCFILSALAVFGILRYARKLHLVERGAKAASGGRYDEPIAVTGGELGSIAASINSISDGINAAVAERMKSERLKTELITNVSHDIRTPLTSLITYTDLLKSEGLDSERATEYLEVLIQKSARLKNLTDDLFEASKAASGSIEAHTEALDLADFVRQVLGELDERVSASGLDFRLSLPERAPVRADGKLLWRVMENLLSNVFKYALKGSRVYIDVTPDNEWYRLDVKNISEHPLNVDPAELTERFKRGDSARSDEGSGLGLSIAQSFVQAQGGRFALSIDGDLFKAEIFLPKEEGPQGAR